jgi:hypothetical protein
MNRYIERWECKGPGGNTCGGAPCRVEIETSDDGMPDHLKGVERFRDRVCLTKNAQPFQPKWVRLPNKPGSETARQEALEEATRAVCIYCAQGLKPSVGCHLVTKLPILVHPPVTGLPGAFGHRCEAEGIYALLAGLTDDQRRP